MHTSFDQPAATHSAASMLFTGGESSSSKMRIWKKYAFLKIMQSNKWIMDLDCLYIEKKCPNIKLNNDLGGKMAVVKA